MGRLDNLIEDTHKEASAYRSDLWLLRAMGGIMSVPMMWMGMEFGYKIAEWYNNNPAHGAFVGLALGAATSLDLTMQMCDETHEELYKAERRIEHYQRHNF